MPGYVEERLTRIEEHLGLPPYQPPDAPLATLAPGQFTAVIDDQRRCTCAWSAIDRPGLRYEVHEFLADPRHSYKATVDATSRTSSPLRPGGTYEWAVRAVDAAKNFSAFTPRIRTTVGTPPDPTTANPVELLPILRGWTLMLPTGAQGDPDNIYPTQAIPGVFYVADGAVRYRAPTTGVHSPNSHYPRAESREMRAAKWDEAAWSNRSGRHVLTVDEAFIELPAAKPHVVGVQIHDASDDVIQVRLEGTELAVHYHDGNDKLLLTPSYALGTRFSVQIVAADSVVKVIYNGADKGNLPLAGGGWYWKVGAYVQSNPDKGDGPGNFGEVAVYSISSTHT